MATAPPPIGTGSLQITGDTYPARKRLRELGCRPGPGNRCWIAPDVATAVYARQLVRTSPLAAFLQGQVDGEGGVDPGTGDASTG